MYIFGVSPTSLGLWALVAFFLVAATIGAYLVLTGRDRRSEGMEGLYAEIDKGVKAGQDFGFVHNGLRRSVLPPACVAEYDASRPPNANPTP